MHALSALSGGGFGCASKGLLGKVGIQNFDAV
jgi:hypothetical protein